MTNVVKIPSPVNHQLVSELEIAMSIDPDRGLIELLKDITDLTYPTRQDENIYGRPTFKHKLTNKDILKALQNFNAMRASDRESL